MRPLFAVGLVCLCVGILLVAGPTFGLSVVESDRGLTASVSDDGGLVGFEETGETVDGDGETTVLRLVNNAGEPIDELDVEVELDGNDPVEVADGFDDPPIEPGDRTGLALECGPGIPGDGEGTLTVVIDRATTASATVESLTRTVEFEYDCTGGQGQGAGPLNDDEPDDGDVRFEELTAQATEQDGEPTAVTFEYELDDEADGVEFVVEYGNREDEVLAEGNEGTATVELSTAGQREYPLEVSANVDGGETCEATIEDDDPIEPCG